MEITEKIRDAIQQKRTAMKLSLTDISRLSAKAGKSTISVSTLSAIEKGKLKGVKDDTFKILGSILNWDVSSLVQDKKIVRVAFGLCCWAAPIINAIVKDSADQNENLGFSNLLFSCYSDSNNNLVPLVTYNQSPEKQHNIFTANETLTLLQENKVDVAFLPVLTAERAPGIVRIARCMNTGKGGVYLFIIGRKRDGNSDLESEFDLPGKYDYEALKKIKGVLRGKEENQNYHKDSCCFIFPKGSIAQKEIEQSLFDDTPYDKEEIEISTTEKFEKEVIEKVNKFFKKDQATYFVYAGWDFHIDKLKTIFKNGNFSAEDGDQLIGREFDAYRFTKFSHPFAMMSYDCITLESKYDYLINPPHPGLLKLLSVLSENVNILNQVKFKNNNSRYRLINKFLQINQDTTNSILNRINWEFLIYPEMFDKNLK